MKNPLKRFADFMGVVGYLFAKGFSASKFHSLACIFFEALAFFWVIVGAISLAVLASSGNTSNLPEQLTQFIPEGQSFVIGIFGLATAMLGGAISKFLSNYIINISLPKIESDFYAEGVYNLAETDIVRDANLEIDVDEYLKRHLSINTRFAMMVYRRLILTFVPVATLFVLLPLLAVKNMEILLAMGFVFLVLIPIYYLINTKSSQITLDMEELSREVSAQRRKAALTILDENFVPTDKEQVIAPTLAQNNPEIKRFFHLYGARFTMSEATNLTNTLVLFLVVGILAFITISTGDTNVNNINIADFIIVLVVLRQVHTVVSRGLLVTNTMSRFYTKLLSLKTLNEKISRQAKLPRKAAEEEETAVNKPDENDETETIITTDPLPVDTTTDQQPPPEPQDDENKQAVVSHDPVDSLFYRRISMDEHIFDMRAGTVHLYFDKTPPSQTTLARLTPEGDTKNHTAFVATHTVEVLGNQKQVFSFQDHIKTEKDIDNILNKHLDLLLNLYDASELRRVPETPTGFIDIMKSTLGDGISYLRPRTIRTYELMIDLQERLLASDADIIILDAKALIRITPPYAEMALKMMEKLDKIIFVMIANHNYSKFGFDKTRMVLVAGPKHAEGYTELGNISKIIPQPTTDPDRNFEDEWE